ncbi:efflux RND transporter periplasmic adaptor subunit [Lysobacter sp. H21R4]|uniref:efflux RND transporter periplasmic adaptor subunit n=1 Tax=Lysobacter sp. H21R4 TaxID=2781021 RepID=UPI00188826E9|nr:efflux RND transporter periplasmic adaptor subunit [Lysobacter sp. H21R4]QOY62443.1 efflux RND transporter periplasmic adaptor subunit [Lysobacter sp. H21R4]
MSIRDTSGQDQSIAAPSVKVRQRRRWLLAGAIALGVLLLGGWLVADWSAGSRSFAGDRLRVATVTRGDLVRDISADGRVIAANSPTLYAIAGGTVTLNVVAGDVVKKGQPLAVIDSPELLSNLAQEQATLASAEAEAGRATLDAQVARSAARRALDQAGVDRQAAERDLQRYRRGFEGGAVSQIDVARAEDALKKSELGLGHARREFSLQGQGATLDSRNKQLLADRQRAVVSELQRQVDLLTLRAPFDGQVGQVLVDQRANVAANAPVLGVVDLSRFEVEIKVPESFARDLAIGMSAQLSGSGGQPLAATVSAVSPEVVNGEVTARLRFADRQPAGLRQNQRMRARVVLDTRENVLMVERGPFVEQGNGSVAYVMDGNVAVRRPIRIGASSLGEVEIVDGLGVGDRVVVSGADQFGDAERVRVN